MIGALASRFPDADSHLCNFHLAKSVWTRVQKLGLTPVYAIPQVKELLRSFIALAFLPTEEVVLGYKDIVAALDNLIRDGVIEGRYKRHIKGAYVLSEQTRETPF